MEVFVKAMFAERQVQGIVELSLRIRGCNGGWANGTRTCSLRF